MTLLLQVHTWFRWIVLGLGLLGMIVSFYQLSGPRRDKLAKVASISFLAALDLQWLLGLILAVGSGLTNSGTILHGAIMTFAVALAHILKRLAGGMPRGRILIYRFLAPVLVILVGHVLLVS